MALNNYNYIRTNLQIISAERERIELDRKKQEEKDKHLKNNDKQEMTLNISNKLFDDKKDTKKEKIVDNEATDLPGYIQP